MSNREAITAEYTRKLHDEIAELKQQLTESQAREARLMEHLHRIQNTVPCQDGSGGFIVDHHSVDGEYIGTQQIDPMWVVDEMASVAHSALALQHDDTALKEYRDAVIEDCIATTNQVLEGLEDADNVADALRDMKGNQ